MTEAPASGLPLRAQLVPPHGRLWAILVLALGGFAIGTGEFSMMGLLPSVARDLHTTVPNAGKLIGLYALGVVVGAPVITIFCARMSRRTLLIGMMGLYAVGNLLSAASGSLATAGVFRFISGLPHGAYFGVAALVAASMVDHDQRGRAVGRVMLGLTVATIIGVPVSSWCGDFIDWHLTYWFVGGLSILTMALLAVALPAIPAAEGASPLTEIGALFRIQVWLALGTAAVGFGGLFAVYSYISPGLVAVTHLPLGMVPLVLIMLGIGMSIGNTVGAYFVDRAQRRTIVGLLIWDAVTSLLFITALPHWWAITADAFLIGTGVALAPALQTRLMDVAADAQSLAASLNHSAFNIANGLGAFFGGVAINAGYGWTSPGWVGASLALGGLVVFLVALALERAATDGAGSGQTQSASRA